MTDTVKVLLGSLGGALVGLVGTVIMALVSYRSSVKDRQQARDEELGRIENRLRDDLLEQYETVKEQRDALAEKLDEFTNFAEAAKRKMQEQDERIDHLCSFIEHHPKIPEHEQPEGLDESSEDWPEVPRVHAAEEGPA